MYANTALDPPSVLAIVVNWNGAEDTVKCLDALKKLDYRNFEIVVVDNCSTDGSDDRIKAQFPELHVFKTSRNVGFGAACNEAVKLSRHKSFDYYLVLNNDIMTSTDFLHPMIRALEHTPKGGIAGPVILSTKEPVRILSAGGKISFTKGRTIDVLVGKTDSVDGNEVDFVQGCCMLIGRQVFEMVGLFNEHYFMYFEDTDLCLRARRNGFRIIVVPDSVIQHTVSASTGYMSATAYYYFTRNRILFVKWHGSNLENALFKFYFLTYYLPGLFAYSLIRRRPDLLRAFLAGTMSAGRVIRRFSSRT